MNGPKKRSEPGHRDPVANLASRGPGRNGGGTSGSHEKSIRYIEDKSGGLMGPVRIGRVMFSKTGRTIYYRGRSFQSLKGLGFV